MIFAIAIIRSSDYIAFYIRFLVHIVHILTWYCIYTHCAAWYNYCNNFYSGKVMRSRLKIIAVIVTVAALCACLLVACDKGGGADAPTFVKDGVTYTYDSALGAFKVTAYEQGDVKDISLLSRVETDSVSADVAEISDNVFAMTDIVSVSIPSTVTKIGESAFKHCSSLRSVAVESGSKLKELGDYSFAFCKSLTSFDFGKDGSLTSIGACAFRGCSALDSVAIAMTVASVGEYAFSDCKVLDIYLVEQKSAVDGYIADGGWSSVWNKDGGNAYYGVYDYLLIKEYDSYGYSTFTVSGYLKDKARGSDVVIPGHIDGIAVGGIAAGAFAGSGITSLTVPASVSEIGSGVLLGCNAKVYCDAAEESRGWVEGWECGNEVVYGHNNLSYTDGNTVIGYVTYGSEAYITSVVNTVDTDYTLALPGQLGGCVVTGFGESLARGISAASVVIPRGVRRIEDYAFEGNGSVKSVVFEQGSQCKSIGYMAFANTAIEGILLPDSVAGIRNAAFNGASSLRTVYIGKSVAFIGAKAFEGSSVAYVFNASDTYCGNIDDIDGAELVCGASIVNAEQIDSVKGIAGFASYTYAVAGDSAYIIKSGAAFIGNAQVDLSTAPYITVAGADYTLVGVCLG